ncbi:MAG TPA: 2Fe-2S iron-sulfur cluster-binding protein [Ktedonobacterales bacterium]|nr:2Fe-2S iron-sulfur cluster-binding protein [Ktedonobacterales bacterium]
MDVAPRDPLPTQGLPVAAPANMLPVRVIGRQEVAPGVVSVFVVLPGTQQAPAPYLPGQFVTLALPTPRETLYRSYSLCGAGDSSEPWELTIKRVEMGAVSNYFYDSVVPGTLLYASLPRGVFTLPGNLHAGMALTMVAIGSGVTPIMGMLRAIARMRPDERPRAQLYYASRRPEDIIFGEELRLMDPQEQWLIQRHYLSSRGDRLDPEAILARADRESLRGHWYMCGPTSVTHDLAGRLERMGVKDSHIHAEVFATAPGPAYKLDPEAEPSEGAHIMVADTGAMLDAQPQETILAALERHGYHPEFSCRAGSCGTCKLRLTQGQASPAGEALSTAEKTSGYVLSCIARPMGDITIASGGRPPKGVARVAGAPAPVAGRSPAAVTLLRLTAIMGVSGLLVGAWNLTNHRPDSWSQAAAAGSSSTAAPAGSHTPSSSPSATKRPRATATSQPGAGGSPKATATPKPSGGPAPTATPKPPAPQPTATSTPSKP